ncbi:MAG: hypothetical protein PVG35_15785 [Desulfobacterales bacterium]|jgi:hypothetical protein
MPTFEKFCIGLLPILFLITLPLVNADRPAHAENPELSTAVFYVQ